MGNRLKANHHLVASVHRASVTIAVAIALVAGCSSPNDIETPVDRDQPTAGATASPASNQNGAPSVTSPSSLSVNMCEVVSSDDIETVLAAAADSERLVIGDPTPLLAGECSFRVERAGTGASHVQLRVGDDFTFGHYRDTEEVTDMPGLGDAAYGFYGVAGPELHVRDGEMWLGVRFGSYDDRFGLTEESLTQLATVVLDRLTHVTD